MSLVVTSNVNLDDTTETSNAFKPYSYQNRLLNTMKIPPNSEIALQSCKINKNGLIVLDRSNVGFAHYFGPPVGGTEVPDLNSSTTQPFFGVAGRGRSFRDGQRVERNIDGFATDIQGGIADSLFHPALINGNQSTLVEVDPINNATSKVFEGYQYKFTQQTAKTDLGGTGLNIVNISKSTPGAPRDTRYPFTYAGNTITSTAQEGFYVQARNKPIGQNNGEVTFDITGLNGAGAQSPFMVGISRINTEKPSAVYGDTFTPDYFNPTREGGGNGSHFQRRGNQTYADICVARAGSSMFVYQTCVNSRGHGGGRNELIHSEVVYYGAFRTDYKNDFKDSIYDIKTNNLSILKIKFKLDNEHVTILGIDDGDKEILIADNIQLKALGGTKANSNLIHPNTASRWAMYPVVSCSGGVGKTAKILKYTAYTNYPDFAVAGNDYTNYDWWGFSESTGGTAFCNELESRPFNDKSSTVDLVPQVLNGSGGMANYQNILICSPSVDYGEAITDNCNTTRTFGFEGMSVTDPPFSLTALITTLKSVSVPRLNGNVSLFIRLNNFTQNSVNARKGTTSKIVGHLPRFDNGGNETGGLYFEPHEKTYLTLNNPDTLYINSFDIDIVYDNETLCTALAGKTIVCFHIRQAK